MRSFLNLFPMRHIRAIPATSGTMLRVGVDNLAICTSVIVCSLLAQGQSLGTLTSDDFRRITSMIALLSVMTSFAYASAGLYARNCSDLTLAAKINRVVLINCASFAIAWAVLPHIGQSISLATVAITCLLSTLMLCLARVGAAVLRSESGRDSAQAPVVHNRWEAPDRKVLVIGGAGYIGSSLVKMLLEDRGLEVSVLDAMHFGEEALSSVSGNPRLTLIREDFRHIETLTRNMAGVGAVVHLGGLVGDPACAIDPELTIDVNVTATKVIGEIAKACGVRRFVFASSCSVYGASREIVEETSRFNPQSLYARSKVASELVLEALNDSDFAVTRLRFATVYGISSRTRFDLVVNLLCAKAVRDGVITVFGPDQWRPFVHVDDVARAIAMALQAPLDQVGGEAFNVGSDEQNFTLGEVAELIGKQVPDAKVLSDPACADVRNYHVSFAKIRDRLGFTPVWTLERGISQVVRLVRSNEVGHYSLPTYSNFLYLKEHGATSFGIFKITGWEDELMKADRVS